MASTYLVRSLRTVASRGPLPVVLCGRNQEVGSAVAAALSPEYTVLQSIMTPEAGKSQLPLLLRSHKDQLPDGSAKDGPIAIIVGGGYTQEDLDSMREACRGLKPIPWLKVAPIARPKPLPPLSDYGKEIGERLKGHLDKIIETGEIEQDKVHLV